MNHKKTRPGAEAETRDLLGSANWANKCNTAMDKNNNYNKHTNKIIIIIIRNNNNNKKYNNSYDKSNKNIQEAKFE
jgi:hypothetical protein